MQPERYVLDITTGKSLFKYLTDITFARGLDFILDTGFIIENYSLPKFALYFGKNPECLLSKAINILHNTGVVDDSIYTIDMFRISYTEAFTKIEDIFYSRGFDNILKNGIDIHLINRPFANSINSVLYIGPYKE